MTQAAFALQWETLDNEGAPLGLMTQRARVFGGWLVRVSDGGSQSLAFVPDGEGRWDGEDFGEDDYEYEEEDEDESDEDADESDDEDDSEDEDEDA